MRRFEHGQRVVVSADYEDRPIPPTEGTVHRLRMADNAAWIRLDRRVEPDEVHPFPANDEHGRGTDIMAWPDTCEPVTPAPPVRREP